MKVLEVISSLGPTGGGETFAVNFSRELFDLADVKVVILYKNNKPFFIERLKDKGLQPIILDKKRHFDLKNAKQLREIIISFKPDVIHTENNALIPVFLALQKTPFKNSIRVFHTMHLLPDKECSNLFVRILYKHIFKNKNFIPVAITKQLSIASSKFYKKDNIPVVYNGVELEKFTNLVPLFQRKYDLVVVGRFSREKNHGFLVHSILKLIEHFPKLRVAFVGDGPLLNSIKEMVDDLHLDGNITFTGVLDDPSIVVNDSKIIALGSLYEANPLSLIEGMSSGCIVISSDVGGVSDIITDKNGFLFETNNVGSFVNNARKILDNLDYFSQVSNFNHNYSSQFSMRGCAANYYNLFKSFNLGDDL